MYNRPVRLSHIKPNELIKFDKAPVIIIDVGGHFIISCFQNDWVPGLYPDFSAHLLKLIFGQLFLWFAECVPDATRAFYELACAISESVDQTSYLNFPAT